MDVGLTYYARHKEEICKKKKEKYAANKYSDRFSERQEAIISGLVNVNDVRWQEFGKLLKKAERLGRTDIVDRFAPLYEEHRKLQREEVKARKKQEYYDKKNGVEIIHRPYTRHVPGTPSVSKKDNPRDYTERQKAIIRGSIAYEDIHGNEYVNLRKKALSIGDTTTAEIAEALIEEKREDVKERWRANRRKNHINTNTAKGRFKHYTEFESNILTGNVDLDKVSFDRLAQLMCKCITLGDISNERIVRYWIRYKEDPTIIDAPMTRRELAVKYQSMTSFPLPFPEGFFLAENTNSGDETY